MEKEVTKSSSGLYSRSINCWSVYRSEPLFIVTNEDLPTELKSDGLPSLNLGAVKMAGHFENAQHTEDAK